MPHETGRFCSHRVVCNVRESYKAGVLEKKKKEGLVSFEEHYHFETNVTVVEMGDKTRVSCEFLASDMRCMNECSPKGTKCPFVFE